MDNQQDAGGDEWNGVFDEDILRFFNNGDELLGINFDDLGEFNLDAFGQNARGAGANDAFLTTADNTDNAVNDSSLTNTNPGVDAPEPMVAAPHGTSPGLNNTRNDIAGIESEADINMTPQQVPEDGRIFDASLPLITDSEEMSDLPQRQQQQPSFQPEIQGNIFEQGQPMLPIHPAPLNTQQNMGDYQMFPQQTARLRQTVNYSENGQYVHR